MLAFFGLKQISIAILRKCFLSQLQSCSGLAQFCIFYCMSVSRGQVPGRGHCLSKVFSCLRFLIAYRKRVVVGNNAERDNSSTKREGAACSASPRTRASPSSVALSDLPCKLHLSRKLVFSYQSTVFLNLVPRAVVDRSTTI